MRYVSFWTRGETCSWEVENFFKLCFRSWRCTRLQRGDKVRQRLVSRRLIPIRPEMTMTHSKRIDLKYLNSTCFCKFKALHKKAILEDVLSEISRCQRWDWNPSLQRPLSAQSWSQSRTSDRPRRRYIMYRGIITGFRELRVSVSAFTVTAMTVGNSAALLRHISLREEHLQCNLTGSGPLWLFKPSFSYTYIYICRYKKGTLPRCVQMKSCRFVLFASISLG